MHSAGDGAGVSVLQGPSHPAGLPVPVPLHCHRLQPLLLHLSGQNVEPGPVGSWGEGGREGGREAWNSLVSGRLSLCCMRGLGCTLPKIIWKHLHCF